MKVLYLRKENSAQLNLDFYSYCMNELFFCRESHNWQCEIENDQFTMAFLNFIG